MVVLLPPRGAFHCLSCPARAVKRNEAASLPLIVARQTVKNMVLFDNVRCEGVRVT